jgi:DNA-binding response OmpR family regulator
MSYRMLVVDDQPPILFAMKEYFAGQGFEVDCAREKEEAEALLSNFTYSIVIVDLRLTAFNGADGLEILGRIAAQYPKTRTIMLTAHGSPEIELEARRRAVDVFLHKPKPLAELAQIVVGLIGSEA